MDSLLCDELLIHIFQRLPPSSFAAVALVSKRWRHLRRLSTTSLSLSYPPPPPLSLSLSYPPLPPLSLSSFLAHHPFLLSLSLCSSSINDKTPSFDQLLLSAAAASSTTLKHLRFLAGPITSQIAISLSFYKPHLISLSISLSRPLSFSFLLHFPSLSEFSVSVSPVPLNFGRSDKLEPPCSLRLESLSVAGIGAGDVGFGWLWKSLCCGGRLRRLRMTSCEGVGDGGDGFSSFQSCLQGLEEVELTACRSIVDGVLMKLAGNCEKLRALLVYDGGSRQGLLDFIVNCRSELERVDLRLPLDLGNEHLFAMAALFRSLKALKLQSCCLVTGEGLKNFSLAMGSVLQELALINCDVVNNVPGLLTTLGQNLRQMRTLDLSYNEMLHDKEFISMLASCNSLVELNLRGCKRLTRASTGLIIRSCKHLESADITHCCRLGAEDVELILGNLPRLRRVQVEQSKVSEVARALASSRCIEVVG